MKLKDKIFTTKEFEGKERVHAFVNVFVNAQVHFTLLAHSWGIMEGVQFFDTIDDQHVELHGKDFNFVIHIPQQGSTFETDGKMRELRDNRVVILQ